MTTFIICRLEYLKKMTPCFESRVVIFIGVCLENQEIRSREDSSNVLMYREVSIE